MTLCSWDRNRTKMAKSMAVSANTISFFPLYAIFPLSWKLHLKFDLAYWTGGGCQPRRRFSYYVWCSIFLSPRLIWKMTFKGTVCPFPPSSKACRIQRQSYCIHSCKGNLKFKEILSWNKKSSYGLIAEIFHIRWKNDDVHALFLFSAISLDHSKPY